MFVGQIGRLFGIELRRRRVEAGLSLDALPRLVHYSKGHLSKVENAVKGPRVRASRGHRGHDGSAQVGASDPDRG